MTEESTTQFQKEGEIAFQADTEKENSADSSSGEETANDSTQPQEGDKENSGDKKKNDGDNLADNPRWQEREKNWNDRFNKQEQRHTDDLSKLRGDFEQKLSTRSGNDSAPVQVPAWFGGDEASWSDFKRWNDAQIENVKKEARESTLNEINTKSTEEQKRIDVATTYFTDQVGSIEGDKTINPDATKVDRNKLLKFVMDNELVDTQGRWNYRAGWRLMQAGIKSTQQKSNQDKKQLANDTIADKHSETTPSAFMTSKDFKNPTNRPW